MGAINSLHGARSVESLARKHTKPRMEGKKNVSKFATLRKRLTRHRTSLQKTHSYAKHVRDLTHSWKTHEINALVEEYESLSALKDLSIQTSLARPNIRSLTDDLLALYQHGHFTDVVLKFKDRHFYCHRFLLSVRSQYFQRLLSKHPGFNAVVDVNVNNSDLTVDVFDIMIRYLYSGDVRSLDIPMDSLDLLFKLGEEFGTPNDFEYDMNILLNTSRYADLVLVFEDVLYRSKDSTCLFELQCHKAILAARSSFFHYLITKLSHDNDSTEPLRVVLDENILPRQYARVLLQCMYVDSIDVSSVIRWSSDSDQPHKLLTITEIAMEVYEIARFLDFNTLEQGKSIQIFFECSGFLPQLFHATFS